MGADVIRGETTFQVEYATLCPSDDDGDGDEDVDSTRRPSVSLVAVLQAVRLHRSAFYDFKHVSSK